MLITIIKRTIRYARVKNAVSHANKMSEVMKKEMFVIQIYKKIRVYDRERINALIDAGVLNKKLNYDHELRKACIYSTYYKNRQQQCISPKTT